MLTDLVTTILKACIESERERYVVVFWKFRVCPEKFVHLSYKPKFPHSVVLGG
jgi:hypothetical protein